MEKQHSVGAPRGPISSLKTLRSDPTPMIKRYLHRRANNLCNTPHCNDIAKSHNKLYWIDPREFPQAYIHSATFCTDCFYRLTHELPAWMYVVGNKLVSTFKHFKTLKECNADYISKVLLK